MLRQNDLRRFRRPPRHRRRGRRGGLPRHATAAITRLVPLLLMALMVLGSAGCASYGHIRFEPNPVDVALVGADPVEGEPALGRALLSVRPIREASDGAGYEVPVRLRIDNDGARAVQLDPETCELVDGRLEPLATLRVGRLEDTAGDPLSVAAGATGVFDLVFGFGSDRTPSDYDLSGLNLRWGLRFGTGELLRWSSTFERRRLDWNQNNGRFYGCHPWLGYHVHPYGFYGSRLYW